MTIRIMHHIYLFHRHLKYHFYHPYLVITILTTIIIITIIITTIINHTIHALDSKQAYFRQQ